MTKQELINTYDSMSMPEEHVEAIEARLKKLFPLFRARSPGGIHQGIQV